MREAIWVVVVALHCVGSLDLKHRASSAASRATILLTADTHTHTQKEPTQALMYEDMYKLYLKLQPIVGTFSH